MTLVPLQVNSSINTFVIYEHYVSKIIDHRVDNYDKTDIVYKDKQLICLAKNIYYEARGESVIGQIAVANVTLNRKNEEGTSICNTVYKPNQFAWTRNKKHKAPHGDNWERAQVIARLAIHRPDLIADVTKGSVYFHSGHKPHIFNNFTHVVNIGGHKFYRE